MCGVILFLFGLFSLLVVISFAYTFLAMLSSNTLLDFNAETTKRVEEFKFDKYYDHTHL